MLTVVFNVFKFSKFKSALPNVPSAPTVKMSPSLRVTSALAFDNIAVVITFSLIVVVKPAEVFSVAAEASILTWPSAWPTFVSNADNSSLVAEVCSNVPTRSTKPGTCSSGSPYTEVSNAEIRSVKPSSPSRASCNSAIFSVLAATCAAKPLLFSPFIASYKSLTVSCKSFKPSKLMLALSNPLAPTAKMSPTAKSSPVNNLAGEIVPLAILSPITASLASFVVVTAPGLIVEANPPSALFDASILTSPSILPISSLVAAFWVKSSTLETKPTILSLPKTVFFKLLTSVNKPSIPPSSPSKASAKSEAASIASCNCSSWSPSNAVLIVLIVSNTFT